MIGCKLKELRQKNNLSQAQIGDFLGVTQSMVARIECDQRQMTVTQLENLCNLFGCTMEYILGESDTCTPLEFAFRAKSADTDVLHVIAAINKISANLEQLKAMEEVGHNEK